jgi:SAM-dependent methyltransferase
MAHHRFVRTPPPHEYSFPVDDGAYDIVLSGQVLEHVRKPWVWIKEVARVCRAGGFVITINPVSWPRHDAPIDCWRAYPEGMKALYEDAGLEVVTSVVDALEVPAYRRYLPGRSPEWQGWKWRVTSRLLGRIGFPVERAYDTITIGRKPPPEAGDGSRRADA